MELLALGGITQIEMGKKCGLTFNMIAKVNRNNRELIEAKRHEIQMRVAKHYSDNLDPMCEGLIESVQDSQNRNQPGAAKALNEMVGIGGKQSHIGDKHTHFNAPVTVDARQIVVESTPEERAKKLAELEAMLG